MAIALTVLIVGLVAVAISLPRVWTVSSVPLGSTSARGAGSTAAVVLSPQSSRSVELPSVAPAAPTAISFAVTDTEAHRRVSVTDDVVPLRANRHADGTWDEVRPSEASVQALGQAAWWQNGLSNAPGSPSRGTTYIYGHSCRNNAEPAWLHCAFDELSFLREGDVVRLTTSNGVLTYRVTQDPVRVPKTGSAQLASNTSVYRAQVNRLVLITCGYERDPSSAVYSSAYNWVVQLVLMGAEATVR